MKQFKSAAEKRDWIEGILHDLREGMSTPEEVEELRSLLMNDSEARRIYLKTNQLEELLSGSPLIAQSQRTPNVVKFPRSVPVFGVVASLAAAALVAILAIAHIAKTSSSTPPESAGHESGAEDSNSSSAPAPPLEKIIIESSIDAILNSSSPVTGAELPPGTHRLTAGCLQLRWTGGTLAVLQAPCTFASGTGSGLKIVEIAEGPLWVSRPHSTREFRISSPDESELRIEEGEFGVISSSNQGPEIHVFDGELKFATNTGKTRLLRKGYVLTPTASIKRNRADLDLFMTPPRLATLRWQAHHEALRDRKDLTFYLALEDGAGSRNRFPNLAPGADRKSKAVLRGASRVTGRISGKDGLLFDRASDEVEASLDETFGRDGFTIAVWVKVDRLDEFLSALVNSTGWTTGDIHFQLTRDGRIRTGIHGRSAFQTKPGAVTPGHWQFMAVSWRPAIPAARIYSDGRPMLLEQHGNNVPLTPIDPKFGQFQIGSHEVPTEELPPELLDSNDVLLADDLPAVKEWRSKNQRTLKGSIDEVMIFRRALNDEEIADLYENSRP